MDTNSRDATFASYQNLVKWCVKKNLTLIKALQLEVEDVMQELSIRLFRAIEQFDTQRSDSLHTYLCYQLQYEMLTIKRRMKPHGMVGAPKGEHPSMFYLDQPREDGSYYEVPDSEDFTKLDFDEVLETLNSQERVVALRMMTGEPVRKKADKQCLESARSKISDYYEGRYRYA